MSCHIITISAIIETIAPEEATTRGPIHQEPQEPREDQSPPIIGFHLLDMQMHTKKQCIENPNTGGIFYPWDTEGDHQETEKDMGHPDHTEGGAPPRHQGWQNTWQPQGTQHQYHREVTWEQQRDGWRNGQGAPPRGKEKEEENNRGLVFSLSNVVFKQKEF